MCLDAPPAWQPLRATGSKKVTGHEARVDAPKFTGRRHLLRTTGPSHSCGCLAPDCLRSHSRRPLQTLLQSPVWGWTPHGLPQRLFCLWATLNKATRGCFPITSHKSKQHADSSTNTETPYGEIRHGRSNEGTLWLTVVGLSVVRVLFCDIITTQVAQDLGGSLCSSAICFVVLGDF